MVRAHLLEKEPESFVEIVRGRLNPDVELTFGTDVPPQADFEILVSGVPELAQLQANPQLRVLLIPWAGLPLKTRDLLLADSGKPIFPHLAVHNLHYNAASTAEMAIALMLASARGIVPLDKALRNDDWSMRYLPPSWPVLERRSALIVGYGAIGKKIAGVCLGLGMKVAAVRRSITREEPGSVNICPRDSLRELLPKSSVLFVSVPHTPETSGLIGKDELELLPNGAIVVNVARGPVVDEESLYRALVGRRLRAGLDVWYRYPREETERENTPPSEYPFRDLDNVVMTPHVGGNTADDEIKRAEALADFLNKAAHGELLPNRVDLLRGY